MAAQGRGCVKTPIPTFSHVSFGHVGTFSRGFSVSSRVLVHSRGAQNAFSHSLGREKADVPQRGAIEHSKCWRSLTGQDRQFTASANYRSLARVISVDRHTRRAGTRTVRYAPKCALLRTLLSGSLMNIRRIGRRPPRPASVITFLQQCKKQSRYE